jgi:LPXTG-motif cell wall-anchored protein
VATSSSHSGTAAASKGGLSAADGAGVTIAALLVFAGLAIGAFVFWRKRRRDDPVVPTGNGNGVGTAGPHELSD